MAQAARLSMRMQKELKLLLSDPPHGASFPHLSSSADLSTIIAHIEGPDDTVYANGIFNLKIQIPERYPFQPPIVAFATPIYHPNIDNSGRICLDILNLPPKGAWQPSLNISTVLMSVRLLLAEPNPDDGLMCDVSREYKYNRQTFDYKAREMTEKYAVVKPDGSRVSLQILENPNAADVESHGDEKAYESGNYEKVKLTEESSITHSENREADAKDIPNSQLLLSNSEDIQSDGNGKRKAVIGFSEANVSSKPKRKKLSLALPPHESQQKDVCGVHLTTACKEYKKPYSTGKKLSLGLKQTFNTVAKSDDKMERNQDARSCHSELEDTGLGEASLPESIVVLDSDDSGKEDEEGTVSSRSRLPLARRGLKCRP